MIRYKTRTDVIKDFSKYNTFEKKEVFIVREDINTGVWIPSQLSEFLRVYCSNDAPSTKDLKGRTICNFINFWLDKVDEDEDPDVKILKEKGLYGLKLVHAAKYLNYISGSIENQNNYATVKKKESIIIDFYYYLQNKGVTKGKDAKIETKIMRKKLANGKESKKGDLVKISPFNEKGSNLYVMFPPKNPTAESGYKRRKPKLPDMKTKIFSLFLEYVENEAPHIAFQVFLQCMGGLRCGEVVNLTVEDITVERSKNRLFLNIQDRQVELFGKKTSLNSEVKFERENQVVFDFNNRLMHVMDRHLKTLANNTKVKCTKKNNRPLFVNEYGKPMTGDVYRKLFNEMRDKFIDWLEDDKPSAAKELQDYEWSTHIGRHLFTNYIIKMGIADNSLGEPDAKILAALRGDTNINSAMAYISKKAMLEAVDRNIQRLSRLAVDYDELLPQMSAFRNLSDVEVD